MPHVPTLRSMTAVGFYKPMFWTCFGTSLAPTIGDPPRCARSQRADQIRGCTWKAVIVPFQTARHWLETYQPTSASVGTKMPSLCRYALK